MTTTASRSVIRSIFALISNSIKANSLIDETHTTLTSVHRRMSSSQKQQQQQQPPKKTTGTRSRTGCWTCRARRKKCDESRPECTQCVNKGIKCGGYGARLKWGNGVASRGYLTGASIPVQGAGRKGNVTGGAKGRKRDVPEDGRREGRKGKSASASLGVNVSSVGGGRKTDERYKRGELVLDFGTAPVQSEAPRAESMSEGLSIGSSVATPETSSTDSMVPEGVKLSPFDAQLLQECKCFCYWPTFY